MFARSLSVGLVLLGLTALAQAAPEKETKPASHEGSVVSAASGKLVITDKDKKEHSFSLAEKVTIKIDGKTAKLEDLKKGTKVTVLVDKVGTATSITSGAEKSETSKTKKAATMPTTPVAPALAPASPVPAPAHAS